MLKTQEVFLRCARAEQRETHNWTMYRLWGRRVNEGEIIHNYRQSHSRG